MNPFSTIREWFIWATQVLVNAALFCYGHWPLEGLGNVFNQLSTFTAQTSGQFWSLASWYDSAVYQLGQILSWDAIRATLISWLPNLAPVAVWFGTWWTSVWVAITTWWSGQASVVRDWIAVAKTEAMTFVQDALSFTWFISWWGNAGVTFSDWWNGARAEISARIDAVIAPVRDQVNSHTDLIRLLTDPGDTALRWLLDRLETAIARLW